MNIPLPPPIEVHWAQRNRREPQVSADSKGSLAELSEAKKTGQGITHSNLVPVT